MPQSIDAASQGAAGPSSDPGRGDGPIASFHLVRYRRRHAPVQLLRYVTQQRPLRQTPGLRFFRVLGTSRGRSMSLSADLARWALFAVWDDDAALDLFLERSPVSAYWRRRGTETWMVRLVTLAAHGSWDGVEPLGHRHEPTADIAPLAVLTRATVRARRWPRFYRAAAATDAVLGGTAGVLASIGVGERPVGRQATFSLWASAHDLADFAYGTEAHTDVIRRTRDERWYSEELFARFLPYRSTGTWDGVDPLAVAGGATTSPRRGAARPARSQSDDGTTGNSMP